MNLLKKPSIPLPSDIDPECIEICNLLNRLPGVKTTESCSGHGKGPFSVFFKCTNIDSLSRLGRTVFKTYSDGNWEILVDSTDTDPTGQFWLRSKKFSPSPQSLRGLIKNINYWFHDDFDDYFANGWNNERTSF